MYKLDTEDWRIAASITSFYYESESSLGNVIITVIQHFNWLPTQLGSFFIDDIDEEGLLYWYNYIIENTPKTEAK